MPIYFQMLQLPKLIVNGPIQGEGYDSPGATQSFLSIDLPFSEMLFGSSINLFGGFELDRQAMLDQLRGATKQRQRTARVAFAG